MEAELLIMKVPSGLANVIYRIKKVLANTFNTELRFVWNIWTLWKDIKSRRKFNYLKLPNLNEVRIREKKKKLRKLKKKKKK